MFLTDSEIAALLAEPKPEVDPRAFLARMKDSGLGHSRNSMSVTGTNGSRFELAVRQNNHDATNFSVILTYYGAGGRMNLLRHNGPSHPHPNRLEKTRLDFVCHVHQATQRYQEAGLDAEGFAVATQEFSDLGGALRSLLRTANFHPPAQGTIL